MKVKLRVTPDELSVLNTALRELIQSRSWMINSLHASYDEKETAKHERTVAEDLLEEWSA